jgi:phosphopantothenoylcysteine decarboxylase/phosphopantothenate--cysteine ligase
MYNPHPLNEGRPMALTGKRILLGLTGGIAAYKAAELTRLLVKSGAEVRVAMTEAATRFVGTATMQALSGQPAWTDLWDPRVKDAMGHIELSRDRDLILVAPASADFMAKLAHGLADDLLSTLCIARRCPLMVAPAMNVEMWQNAATQRNAATLRADGVQVVGPASGGQACGEMGMGRMTEPADILGDVRVFFSTGRGSAAQGSARQGGLAGRRVVVTAGPTEEPIDPVRVITNTSSGKMGYAVASAARDAGAEVTLISGPVSLPTPAGVSRIDVRTAREMFDAVKKDLKRADVFISVAAVADYRVKSPSAQKIKKVNGHLSLELIENPDILAWVAARPKPPFCVGFAAESEDLAKNAKAKLAKKKLPLIAANLAQEAFGRDESALTLYDAKGGHPLGRGPKIDLARKLVEHIAKALPRK